MTGIERRSQIDTETVKALLIVNGGGAVALLTFANSILDKTGFTSLTRAVLVGIVLNILGLAFAVLHNHLRRRCSLVYEHHNLRPPAGKILRVSLRTPTVCFFSSASMWLSLGLFVSADLLVAAVGLLTV